MSIKSKSIKNLFYTAIGQFIAIVIGFLIPRLYIGQYGSEIHGLLTSVNQYIVYLALFEAGIGAVTLQALYKPMAVKDYDEANGILSATSRYYKKTGTFCLIGLIILSLIYPLLVYSNIQYWLIVFVVFLSGISLVILYFAQAKYKVLLQADGREYVVANLTTLINLLIAVAKVVCILLGLHFIVVLIVSALINLVQAFFILFYIKKHYLWLNLNVQPNNQAISQRNYTLVHQIASLIFNNTDILLLSVFCNLKIVSLYSVYKLVISNIETFLTIIMNSFNFILGQTFQIDKDKFKEYIDAFESFHSAICFAVFAVTLYLFLPFIRIYTGGVGEINYVDVKLSVLFVLIAVLTVMRKPMLHTINYAGHFKLTLPQTIIETALNILFSIIGVFCWGIYGVLLGTFVALLYRTNDIIIYANVKILKRKPWKTYIIYLINFMIFFASQLIFRWLFPEVEGIKDFLLVGVGASFIAFCLFLGSQIIIFPNSIKTIKKFLKTK